MTCARTYGTGKSLTRMGTIELLCSGSAGSYVQRPGCCQDIKLLYYFFWEGGGGGNYFSYYDFQYDSC